MIWGSISKQHLVSEVLKILLLIVHKSVVMVIDYEQLQKPAGSVLFGGDLVTRVMVVKVRPLKRCFKNY